MKRATLLLALSALAATPALAGYPWISVELPANPFDRATNGAYAVVHTYQHAADMPFEVTGTAEGLVDGRRRSLRLDLQPTGRTGTFALRRSWPDGGVWVLRLGIEGVAIGAAVGVGADGQVAFVRVPLTRGGAPRAVSSAEVEMLLRALAENRPAPALATAGWNHPEHRRQLVLQVAGMSALGGAVLAGLFVGFRRRRRDG